MLSTSLSDLTNALMAESPKSFPEEWRASSNRNGMFNKNIWCNNSHAGTYFKPYSVFNLFIYRQVQYTSQFPSSNNLHIGCDWSRALQPSQSSFFSDLSFSFGQKVNALNNVLRYFKMTVKQYMNIK